MSVHKSDPTDVSFVFEAVLPSESQMSVSKAIGLPVIKKVPFPKN